MDDHREAMDIVLSGFAQRRARVTSPRKLSQATTPRTARWQVHADRCAVAAHRDRDSMRAFGVVVSCGTAVASAVGVGASGYCPR
jgi:hypothetical protein